MKICAAQMVIAMTVCAVSLAHENYGQVLDKKVTVDIENVSLEEALYEIQDASGVKIYFSLEVVETERDAVSIRTNEEALGVILNNLLHPRGIQYKVDEKHGSIIILKKAAKQSKIGQSYNVGSLFLSNPFQIDELITVTGIVTDAATQQPLAGVNIVVRGTTNGTTTDADGRYTINVEDDAVLVFSFIGYETSEVTINARSSIDVALIGDIRSLQEVTVFSTGYADESPERATGSFMNIGRELLERNVGSDVLSRLNGIAPSLLVDQRSGKKSFLNIRGRSTIFANDQPLIVVDNFPYNGDLSTINPNDIESITILKDAAAASIWGVRAGNGVIVITTKTGTANSPLEVNVNISYSIGDKPDLFYRPQISSKDFVEVERMLFNNGFYENTIKSPMMLPLTPVVEILLSAQDGDIGSENANKMIDALKDRDIRNDLEKHFYRKSLMQQYAVNFKGGTDKATYFVSSGFDKSLSNEVGNDYSRLTLNAQNKFTLLPSLELNTRVVMSRTDANYENTLAAIRMGGGGIYPYASLTDQQGRPISITKDYRKAFEREAEAMGFLDWSFNPIEELDYTDNSSKMVNIRTMTTLNYAITDWLSLSMMYQYESQAFDGKILEPVESYSTRRLINLFSSFDGSKVTGNNIPIGGVLTLNSNNLASNNGRAQFNFNKELDQQTIRGIAGFEVRQTKSETFGIKYYGYNKHLGTSTPVNLAAPFVTYPEFGYRTIPTFNTVEGTIDRYRSYYGNISYTYDGRLTAFLSGRIDQSNLFGVRTNQKSAPLWSIGTRWNVGKELFMRKLEWLSRLGLRASYGYNGNIDPRVTAFTTARFLQSQWTQREAARITSPPNPELRWEKNGVFNVGIDFDVKNERLSGSVEYYAKKGTDLIGFSPLDPTTGWRSYKGNVASLIGHGWDVVLHSDVVRRDIEWRADMLFSYAIDEVTKYEVTPTSMALYFLDGSLERGSTNEYTPTVGRPLFSIYSYRSAGLDPDTGAPRGYVNNEPSSNYSDIFANATVDSLKYHGPALPPLFGSLRNTFSYKGLSISLNIGYRFGYYFRRNSISYSTLFSSRLGHADFAKRWQQPGDENHTSVPAMRYPADPNADAFYLRTDELVSKADNIRLQDIQISYHFNQMRLRNLGLRSLQIYGYVNNLGLLWRANKADIDPDYPDLMLPRSYSIGVRVGF